MAAVHAVSFSLADPYPWYHWLQEEKPVYQSSDGGWIITRYADAEQLLNDRRCAHWGQDEKTFAFMPPMEKAIAQTLHALAPGNEPAFRKQIMHQLAARSLRIEEDSMKEQARTIRDALSSKPEIEFMRDFAHPFTFGTICRVIGIPETEMKPFADLVAEMKGGYLSLIPEATHQHNENPLVVRFVETLRKTLQSKQGKKGNDLCSALLEIAPLNETNESFFISMLTLLLYAGHENMMHFLGNAVLSLQENTNAQEQIGKSFAFALESIDELIRYNSPLQYIVMLTSEAIELHGKEIPAGSRLMICIGAANRDPLKFENPDQLNLLRKPKHLGFGTGAFRCIGARLAQLQGAVGLHSFFEKIDSCSVLPDGVNWSAMPVQRGPSVLQLKTKWKTN